MFKPDRINIHELTIEEPEKPSELPFDPERDITEEDRAKMEEWRKHHMKGNWQVVAEICAQEKILGRAPELTESDWEELRDERENQFDRLGYMSLAEKARNEAIAGRTPKLSEEQWENIRKSREKDRLTPPKKGHHSFFANLITSEAVLGRPPKLSEDDWKYLSECREKNKRSIGSLIEILEAEAILGRKPILDEDDWSFLKTEWEKHRNDPAFDADFKFSWKSSLDIAACMAVISADKIKIPKGGGLELIYNKKSIRGSQTPPLPEIKKF